MPEFELWQPSDERAKLLVLLRRKTTFPILQTFILRQGWIEFWLQEGKEEIQEVYAQRVANWIEF